MSVIGKSEHITPEQVADSIELSIAATFKQAMMQEHFTCRTCFA